jgi:hypothetical protein
MGLPNGFLAVWKFTANCARAAFRFLLQAIAILVVLFLPVLVLPFQRKVNPVAGWSLRFLLLLLLSPAVLLLGLLLCGAGMVLFLLGLMKPSMEVAEHRRHHPQRSDRTC